MGLSDWLGDNELNWSLEVSYRFAVGSYVSACVCVFPVDLTYSLSIAESLYVDSVPTKQRGGQS